MLSIDRLRKKALCLFATWALLQPNVADIFHVETLSTAGALAAAILDILVNAWAAKHMAAAKQNDLLITLVAYVAGKTSFQYLDLRLHLLHGELGIDSGLSTASRHHM